MSFVYVLTQKKWSLPVWLPTNSNTISRLIKSFINQYESTSDSPGLYKPKFCQRQYVLLFFLIAAAKLRIFFFPPYFHLFFLLPVRLFLPVQFRLPSDGRFYLQLGKSISLTGEICFPNWRVFSDPIGVRFLTVRRGRNPEPHRSVPCPS